MVFKNILFTFFVAGVLAQYDNNGCLRNENLCEFEVVEDTFKNVATCIKKLYNPNTLYRQIEAATPVGALPAVFQKYCENSAPFKACILDRSITAISNPYEKLRGEITSVDNVIGQVIDFLCYNHGERLSEFINNDGPRCFYQQSNRVVNCFDQVKQYVPSVSAALALSQQEKCAKYEQVTSCIISTLDECATPTSGSMAKTLFSSIYNDSPCKNYYY